MVLGSGLIWMLARARESKFGRGQTISIMIVLLIVKCAVGLGTWF